MGEISYWMSDSLRNETPGSRDAISLAEALTLTGLVIEREDRTWVLRMQGFPREWHPTRGEAESSAARWSHMEATIEDVSGPTWLVFGGDQYIFTATSEQEAELRSGGRRRHVYAVEHRLTYGR